jgi:hypothetical protein
MASASLNADRPEPLPGAIPTSVRWLLPALTLLLTALAVYQLVYFAPRCLWVLQRFGAPQPGYLRLLLTVPEEAVVVAGLALGVFAFWQRRFVGRSALLATTALAVNVALLICLVSSLFELLSRLP